MSTASQPPTYIAPDGLLTIEDTDSQIFGYGTEAQRPVSGTVTGDIYIVLDSVGGVYRWDIWNGVSWNPFQGNPVGSTSGVQGDVLYRGAATWDRLAAGTAYQFLQTLGAGANPSWSNYKIYPAAGADPVAPAPAAGDLYYNTDLTFWMSYDATRLKWLSVESNVFSFGRHALTAPGSYYKGLDGITYGAATGYSAIWNGTVVAMSYTREDVDAATFEVTASGAAISTLASASLSGYTASLNNNFNQGDILAVRNQSGGNTTEAVSGWVRIRWRDT